MKFILESILARVQRDLKVRICHFLWMGNHVHMLIVAKDALQCINFYGEVKKQITDAIKQLLGLEYLNLWQKNGTSVIPYGDAEGVIERIAYIYANPARAHLVDTVESYPGLSTWEVFRSYSDALFAKHIKNCPWVRCPAIEKLPVRSVSRGQDRAVTEHLRRGTTEEHQLIIEPNAWMKSFNISEEEVAVINKRIDARRRDFEQEARKKRSFKGLKTLGPAELCTQPLSLNYTPKKKTRRIFAYALSAEIRISMLEAYKRFCEKCSECYQRWKVGDYTVEWPPGAFLPAMPPRANYFVA